VVPEVLSLPEAATLAALLPEQPVNLRAMRSLLFEGHFEKRIKGLEGVLLRVVQGIDSAVMPASSRGVLIEAFNEGILREARARGEAPSATRDRISNDPAAFAAVAGIAIDATAIKNPLEKQAVLARLEELLKPEEEPSSERS
jgi:hypothetical protein